MIAHGGGDFGGFTLGGGIISAYKTLKFGELPNHAGDEISLSQTRGALGEVG
jgi:hypothetical protein